MPLCNYHQNRHAKMLVWGKEFHFLLQVILRRRVPKLSALLVSYDLIKEKQNLYGQSNHIHMSSF